ncbi:hypothetical protein [Parapedobacter sp.]
MKTIGLLSIFLLVSCGGQADNFDFMVGEWKRSNDEAGRQTFETWEKRNDSTYIGHGYTLSGTDTVWQENIILSPIAGVWHYQVSMPGDTASTDFRVSESDARSFTCKNPHNEFPKTISYRRAGTDLHADISGGGNAVTFLFMPME